jgi:hypothetical protein
LGTGAALAAAAVGATVTGEGMAAALTAEEN